MNKDTIIVEHKLGFSFRFCNFVDKNILNHGENDLNGTNGFCMKEALEK